MTPGGRTACWEVGGRRDAPGLPDPIEAIKTRMDDLGLEAKDLVAAIGDKGTVSKVLNRRIPLSFAHDPQLNRVAPPSGRRPGSGSQIFTDLVQTRKLLVSHLGISNQGHVTCFVQK